MVTKYAYRTLSVDSGPVLPAAVTAKGPFAHSAQGVRLEALLEMAYVEPTNGGPG